MIHEIVRSQDIQLLHIDALILDLLQINVINVKTPVLEILTVK